MLRKWSDDYRIGIEKIDMQHKGFFEPTHRLYEYILNCEGEKIVEESIEFLREYAASVNDRVFSRCHSCFVKPLDQ